MNPSRKKLSHISLKSPQPPLQKGEFFDKWTFQDVGKGQLQQEEFPTQLRKEIWTEIGEFFYSCRR